MDGTFGGREAGGKLRVYKKVIVPGGFKRIGRAGIFSACLRTPESGLDFTARPEARVKRRSLRTGFGRGTVPPEAKPLPVKDYQKPARRFSAAIDEPVD